MPALTTSAQRQQHSQIQSQPNHAQNNQQQQHLQQQHHTQSQPSLFSSSSRSRAFRRNRLLRLRFPLRFDPSSSADYTQHHRGDPQQHFDDHQRYQNHYHHHNHHHQPPSSSFHTNQSRIEINVMLKRSTEGHIIPVLAGPASAMIPAEVPVPNNSSRHQPHYQPSPYLVGDATISIPPPPPPPPTVRPSRLTKRSFVPRPRAPLTALQRNTNNTSDTSDTSNTHVECNLCRLHHQHINTMATTHIERNPYRPRQYRNNTTNTHHIERDQYRPQPNNSNIVTTSPHGSIHPGLQQNSPSNIRPVSNRLAELIKVARPGLVENDKNSVMFRVADHLVLVLTVLEDYHQPTTTSQSTKTNNTTTASASSSSSLPPSTSFPLLASSSSPTSTSTSTSTSASTSISTSTSSSSPNSPSDEFLPSEAIRAQLINLNMLFQGNGLEDEELYYDYHHHDYTLASSSSSSPASRLPDPPSSNSSDFDIHYHRWNNRVIRGGGAGLDMLDLIPIVILSENLVTGHEHLPACAVCCDDLVPGEQVLRLSKCGHLFHGDCIRPWLLRKNACPVCRIAIPKDVAYDYISVDHHVVRDHQLQHVQLSDSYQDSQNGQKRQQQLHHQQKQQRQQQEQQQKDQQQQQVDVMLGPRRSSTQAVTHAPRQSDNSLVRWISSPVPNLQNDDDDDDGNDDQDDQAEVRNHHHRSELLRSSSFRNNLPNLEHSNSETTTKKWLRFVTSTIASSNTALWNSPRTVQISTTSTSTSTATSNHIPSFSVSSPVSAAHYQSLRRRRHTNLNHVFPWFDSADLILQDEYAPLSRTILEDEYWSN